MGHRTLKLALGLDFGTESVRALFVDTETGQELGEGICPYRSGVMDRELLGAHVSKKITLDSESALQNAQDYLDAMASATRAAAVRFQAGGVSAEIIGVGVDFTASTPMPVREGKPLSAFLPEDPHAYVKLWKHHSAQAQADFVNAHASPELLSRYGGAVSSEWSLPKLMEMEAKSKEAFEQMELWIEAGDWIVSVLAGRATQPVRSRCQAGYKGLWSEDAGYPAPAFLEKCSPQIATRFERLMQGAPRPLGESAGTLCAEWAEKMGLGEMAKQAVVAVAAIDAHAGVPGSGVARHGELLCVLGTSTCHMGLHRELHHISGIAGAVPDGIIPGLVGYESGQPAVGDLFSWFLKSQNLPDTPEQFAKLENAAKDVEPGSNGVMALDWWNGTRCPTMDSNLKGTWTGMRLTTTQAELYRSLLEATAYGTRLIVETLKKGGVEFSRIVLSGGIAAKSPLLCQIYADVLGHPVDVVHARQPVALGAAIYGAAAALKTNTASAFSDLVAQMSAKVEMKTVRNNSSANYDSFYSRYLKLSQILRGFYRDEV